jgi:hypothetical protein
LLLLRLLRTERGALIVRRRRRLRAVAAKCRRARQRLLLLLLLLLLPLTFVGLLTPLRGVPGLRLCMQHRQKRGRRCRGARSINPVRCRAATAGLLRQMPNGVRCCIKRRVEATRRKRHGDGAVADTDALAAVAGLTAAAASAAAAVVRAASLKLRAR